MSQSIADTPYEELETKWDKMLWKFARWNIGIDHSDLYQEMRTVLYVAQQSFDSSKGAAFSTYLFRALLNKIRKINHYHNNVKKRIPSVGLRSSVSLEQATVFHPDFEPETLDDLDTIELLIDAPHEVRAVAKLLLAGCAKDELPMFMKMTTIETGMRGLKNLLTIPS